MKFNYYLKSLATLGCLFLGSLSIMAEDEVTVLRIHLTDGTTSAYELGKDAKIRFANASMLFSDPFYQFEIPLNSIARWSYANQISGLDKITENGDVSISRNGDKITLSGLSKGVDLTVFSSDGKLIYSVRCTTETYTLHTDSWNPGVYLIKAGNSTFKTVKL